MALMGHPPLRPCLRGLKCHCKVCALLPGTQQPCDDIAKTALCVGVFTSYWQAKVSPVECLSSGAAHPGCKPYVSTVGGSIDQGAHPDWTRTG